MKFQDCTSMNSTENIQEGYRNGLSKMAHGNIVKIKSPGQT